MWSQYFYVHTILLETCTDEHPQNKTSTRRCRILNKHAHMILSPHVSTKCKVAASNQAMWLSIAISGGHSPADMILNDIKLQGTQLCQVVQGYVHTPVEAVLNIFTYNSLDIYNSVLTYKTDIYTLSYLGNHY